MKYHCFEELPVWKDAINLSMLRLLDSTPIFSELKTDILELIPLSLSISRQLRSCADSLQNTDIRGQRYLNERSRQSAKEAQERDEFLEELKRIREGKRPGTE